ncbi:hypothetical protein JCM8547_003479 [Rhodosporidiobolus lusitaniae]
MRAFILLSSLAAGLASAHMELQYPPPINSKYDPQTLEANKDYSMTAPLNSDGSNYMCKGYNTAEAYATLTPVATLKAGSDLEIELAGTATHGGGSCQFSVSYDQGETFAVIHSVIGSCPLSSTYSVPIPSNLPSATSATFAWTWQNLVGNREMYGNCAIVNIEGSSAKSFTGPTVFRANTFSDGSCITVEGEDVVYPNPGDSVEYGGSVTKSTAATTLSNCNFDEDANVTISPSGGSSSSGSGSTKSTLAASSSRTTSAAATTTTARRATSTSQLVVKTTTTTTASTRTRNSWKTSTVTSATAQTTAKPTTTTSNAKPTTTSSSVKWYVATASPANFQASVTTTSSSAPAATSSAASSSSSSNESGTWIECTSTSTWSLCDSNGCTAMGSVAAGTQCKGNAIVMASSSRMVRVRRGTDHAAHATAEHVRRGVRDHASRARSH